MVRDKRPPRVLIKRGIFRIAAARYEEMLDCDRRQVMRHCPAIAIIDVVVGDDVIRCEIFAEITIKTV